MLDEYSNTLPHAMLSPPPTAIVKTCDRPHSLVRCLESLARSARGLGSTPRSTGWIDLAGPGVHGL